MATPMLSMSKTKMMKKGATKIGSCSEINMKPKAANDVLLSPNRFLFVPFFRPYGAD